VDGRAWLYEPSCRPPTRQQRRFPHAIPVALGHLLDILLPFLATHSPPWRISDRSRDQRVDSDARDLFITSVEQGSSQDALSRAKSHDARERARPRWRPKTSNDKDVDPARHQCTAPGRPTPSIRSFLRLRGRGSPCTSRVDPPAAETRRIGASFPELLTVRGGRRGAEAGTGGSFRSGKRRRR
jgi:hypothetical protein